MKRAVAIWNRWVTLLDRREPATSLALARALVGAVLLADLLIAASLGLVESLWAPPADGGMAYGAGVAWLDDALGGGTGAAWGMWAICATAAACFCTGLFTRTSAVVLVVAYAQVAMLLPEADRGIDTLFRAALVVFAFSGAGATLSLDARIRHGRFARPDALVTAWPRYLLVAQMAWLYFSAATNKLQSPWTPIGGFSALHYVLLDPHFARFDTPWLGSVHWLTRTATFFTMCFEWLAPLMPLAMYYRATPERGGRLRRLLLRIRFYEAWLILGVSFHISLALTVRLGIFPYGVLALYPVFVEPAHIHRGLAKLGSKARGVSSV
jgi:hypothetical protein